MSKVGMTASPPLTDQSVMLHVEQTPIIMAELSIFFYIDSYEERRTCFFFYSSLACYKFMFRFVVEVIRVFP
jgi:hypothetical protein